MLGNFFLQYLTHFIILSQGSASVSDLHTVSSVPDLNCMLGAPCPPMHGACHVCQAATFENKVGGRGEGGVVVGEEQGSEG